MQRLARLILLLSLGAASACVNRPAALTEWLEGGAWRPSFTSNSRELRVPRTLP